MYLYIYNIHTHVAVLRRHTRVYTYYCSARHSYTYLCTDATFPFSSNIYIIYIIFMCANTVTNYNIQNEYNNNIQLVYREYSTNDKLIYVRGCSNAA